MDFDLVEPLRALFKDEVRAVGAELGLPDEIVWRQPFPGPGLGVRIIGEVTPDKVAILQEADAIVREEIDARRPRARDLAGVRRPARHPHRRRHGRRAHLRLPGHHPGRHQRGRDDRRLGPPPLRPARDDVVAASSTRSPGSTGSPTTSRRSRRAPSSGSDGRAGVTPGGSDAPDLRHPSHDRNAIVMLSRGVVDLSPSCVILPRPSSPTPRRPRSGPRCAAEEPRPSPPPADRHGPRRRSRRGDHPGRWRRRRADRREPAGTRPAARRRAGRARAAVQRAERAVPRRCPTELEQLEAEQATNRRSVDEAQARVDATRGEAADYLVEAYIGAGVQRRHRAGQLQPERGRQLPGHARDPARRPRAGCRRVHGEQVRPRGPCRPSSTRPPRSCRRRRTARPGSSPTCSPASTATTSC